MYILKTYTIRKNCTLTLKLLACRRHRRHNVGHMAQHRGEQHQAEQQLGNHEHILGLGARPRQITDGGQRQRAPVETLQILLYDIVRFAVVVHPRLRTEAIILINQMVQAPVPVEYHQQIVYQRRRPEHIRIVRVALGAIHERPKPVDLHQPKRAQYRIETDGQVEEVQRQQAQAVNVERRRVHVMGSQLFAVRLQDAVLQVAGPKVEQNIDQIQQIGHVVEAEPDDDRVCVDLLEREPIDDHPEIVQKGETDDHGPVVAQTTGRIEHE